MATGDIQVVVTQVTTQEGIDFDASDVILATVFPATNTDVTIQVIPRKIDGAFITYDVIAQGRIA